MKERIFIDTGFWIALMDRKDQNHRIVKENLKHILLDYILYTSEFVIYETITYLNCSIKNHPLAVRFLEKMEKGEGIIILDVDIDMKSESLNIFKRYSDKYLSFVDCTSFALIKKKRIDRYAGFDRHFLQSDSTPFFPIAKS